MKNSFFRFNFEKFPHWHFFVVYPTENSEDKDLKVSIGLWKLQISIGFWSTTPKKVDWENGNISRQYGISYFEGHVFIYRLDKPTIALDMPWQWQIVRHDLLLPDGSVHKRNLWNYDGREMSKHINWYDIFNGWEDKRIQDRLKKKYSRTVKLKHFTKDGREQNAVVTLTGEEREWRWKWFTWLPLFSKIERVVYCDSDTELGKRAGSWKGGMMGWSCEWDINESMEGAFRRWYDRWDGN